MATPFLSEIKMVSFGFAPKGWALCNGQLLPINQNQALFSLMGTTYGGDGRVNFALPNLQARVPAHQGPEIVMGQVGGAPAVTLNINQVNHGHLVAATNTPTANTAAGNFPAPAASNIYGSGVDTSMNAGTIGQAGGSQPHDNMQPYLVVNFIIALQGIFPSQN
jgi:microcystin-dependent protein